MLLCALLLLFAAAFLSGGAIAAEPEASARRLEPIAVKAGRPDTWPAGDWVPIRRRALNELVERARPEQRRPRNCWIEQATYSASFDGVSLRGGRLTAEVRHDGEQAALLSLEPLSLAVSELSWSDQSAKWGTLGNGDTALLVDGGNTVLEGRWNLTGRKLPRSVEFDFQIPSAAVSRVRLTLPEEYMLTASAGAVIAPGDRAQPDAEEPSGLDVWELDLGSQTRCRITIRRQPDQTSARPLVLTDSNHSYVIREDGIQLQSEFQVEAAGAAVNLFVFDVPADINVSSVTYGSNSSLAWRVISSGGNQQLAVQLADPLLGRSRPIRIAGIAPSTPGQAWRLPQPQLQTAFGTTARLGDVQDEFFSGGPAKESRGAVFLSGQVHLKVEAPLELQSVEAEGFRQTATVSAPDVSSSSSYQQHLPDARLTLEVNYPELRRHADVLTHVDVSGESWSMTAKVDCSARAGKTFETRIQLAPAWEVREVKSLNQASALTNWEVRRESGGGRTLTIEFREAVAPGMPKSVEIVARRLSLPPRRPLRLPVLRPLEHGSAEQLIAVSHPAAAVPALEAGSAFAIVAADSVPNFAAGSELWQAIQSTASGSKLLLRSTDGSAEGRLALEQSGPAVDAHVWITHALDSTRLLETLEARLRPRGEAIDKVLVYLTTTGGDLEWKLPSAAPPALKSTRLAIDRHADWDLPPGGELWEIQLPRLLRREFTIVGTRSRRIAASMMPTLAAVPGANSFVGVVELQTSGGVDVEAEAEGLISFDAASIDSEEFPDAAAREAFGWLWRFQSADDALLLRLRWDEDESTRRATAALKLKSILSDELPGFDRHSATLRLMGGMADDAFKFELPQPAVLLSASLNGDQVTPHRRGSEWVVPLAPDARFSGDHRNTIQIEYQTPSAAGELGRRRTIPVPQCSCTILDFDWQFATPPDVWVVREPEGMVLRDRLGQLSWTERFFGPLGRPVGGEIFNPLSAASWAKLAAAGSGAQRQDRIASALETAADQFSPAGWTIHRATAPLVPQNLTLATERHSQAWLLAWLGTLGCLICGLLMRVRQSPFRKGAFGYWLSSCLFAAWLSPPFYALIAGGCVVGTVVALLFPRRLLERLRFKQPADEAVPLGSTASFQQSPATALLVFVTFTVAGAVAQDEPAAKPGSDPSLVMQPSRLPAGGTPAPQPAGGTVAAQADRLTNGEGKETKQAIQTIRVLVPGAVGNADHPTGFTEPGSIDEHVIDEHVVYVERDTLSNLRRLARRSDLAARYLVSSAEYAGRVDEHNAVVVAAKYTIHLLPGARKAQVAFPSARANPGRCLVNGNPHPLALAEDEQQFYVELTRPADDTLSDAVLAFDVSLEFRPATEGVAAGSGYRLSVIPVASARLEQEFPQALPTIELNGARGGQSVADDRRSLSAMLGRTGQYQVLWSKNAEPVQTPARLEASVTTHVEARPTWLEFRYHAGYRVLAGQVDFVVWQLPHAFDNMIVREVAVNGEPVDDFSAASATGSGSRLLVQFAEPWQRDFTVEALVVVPHQAGDPGEVHIPAAPLIDDTAQPYALSETQNLLGVNAPSEFDIVRPESSASVEGAQNLSIQAFLERSAARPSTRTPRFAYEIRQAEQSLPFVLTPSAPVRKVRMTQTGTVRGDVLEWSLTADLETSRAPVFSHRLRVSPRLTITDVSVRQDDAERLVHWSRRGNFVELFLSDKTAGIQSITLKGESRLPRATTVALPLIEFDQTETSDTRLWLFHEPRWVVKLLEAEALESINNTPAPNGGKLELLGQYRVLPGHKPPRIQVRPQGEHVRAEAAVRISRQAEGTWQIAYDYRFDSDEQAPPIERIRLRLPAAIAERYRVESPQAEQRFLDQADGSIQLDLASRSPAPHSLDVQVVATIDEPPVGDWSLPQVVVENIASAGRYLLISGELGLQPAGRGVDRVLPAALPAGVRRLASAEFDDDEWAAYFVESSKTSFAVGPAGAELEAPRIPLMETRVVRSSGDESFGRTVVWIARLPRDELELVWPDKLALRAVFVDGRSVVARRAGASTLSVPLAAGPGPHRVELHWVQPAIKSPPGVSRGSQPLPAPRQTPVERSIVAIVPPGDAFYTARGNLDVTDKLDYALEGLEGLYELSKFDGGRSAPPALRDMLQQRLHWIEQALARDAGGSPDDPQQTARLEHFDRLARGIAELRSRPSATVPVPPLALPSPWGRGLDEGGDAQPTEPLAAQDDLSMSAVAPNRGALLGRTPAANGRPLPAISFWAIKKWVAAVVLLLIGLPLIPLVRRLVKLEIGHWLFRHQPAAWAMLGLLWWACLRPSEAGLLLLVVSLGVAVRERRRTSGEPESVVNVPPAGS